METKYVKVPFDLELAKKITNGEVEGRIVTRGGDSVRIVCWDYKSMSGDYPILALVSSDAQELSLPYSGKGKYNVYGYNMEDSLDLILEITEYMTFKDGDVLTYRPNVDRWCIFIYKGNDSGLMHNYVTYDCDSRGNNVLTFGKSSYTSTLCESSTEEEKQKLIEALKASEEPKAKEYLKRFFGIEQKQEYEFKPFDKVLVRDDEEDDWKLAEYSHKTESNQYYVVGGLYWLRCIPYNEKTAHLLGKTEDYKEE